MAQTRSQIRRAAGFTLLRLAKRTGVSSSRLSLWERHEARLRDAEVAAVAAALIEGLSSTPERDEIEEILIEGDSE
jgi:transcriptional regulator with XRE-family HTH domain